MPPGGQSCVLSTGLQAGVFPCSAGVCSRRPLLTAVQLTAIEWDTRNTQTERERDTAGGGGVATWLQRQSVIAEYCGWADRDQVLIEACRSVQCVVHGFLETSAHKPHRYISRYPAIYDKKSQLIVRKIWYVYFLRIPLPKKQNLHIFDKLFQKRKGGVS